jgi:hypothetical protein
MTLSSRQWFAGCPLPGRQSHLVFIEEIVEEVPVALSTHYSSSGLDVWFKEDIQNALKAVDSANAELFKVINTPEMRLYRQGYEAAIRAVAEAFGIRHESPACRHEETPIIIDVTPP